MYNECNQHVQCTRTVRPARIRGGRGAALGTAVGGGGADEYITTVRDVFPFATPSHDGGAEAFRVQLPQVPQILLQHNNKREWSWSPIGHPLVTPPTIRTPKVHNK